MASRPTASIWGPVAVFAAMSLLLAAALVWRAQEPPQTALPIAQRAIALFETWTAGGLKLDTERAPSELPLEVLWRTTPGPLGRLDFGTPAPLLPSPWAGAMSAPGPGGTIFLTGFAGPAGRILITIAPASSQEALGPLAGPLESEWAQYEFDAAGRSVLAWRRGAWVFTLVADRPLDEARTWVPAVSDALRGVPSNGAVTPSRP